MPGQRGTARIQLGHAFCTLLGGRISTMHPSSTPAHFVSESSVFGDTLSSKCYNRDDGSIRRHARSTVLIWHTILPPCSRVFKPSYPVSPRNRVEIDDAYFGIEEGHSSSISWMAEAQYGPLLTAALAFAITRLRARVVALSVPMCRPGERVGYYVHAPLKRTTLPRRVGAKIHYHLL
ncbi:uncharacterized protein K460DRAFT_63916 [Cucurbitaria berberidis CBS 394.84]|uniref:Uncharacterized protein n=1 Tax=Cucurbitaria berberidis CBS 394.84 TaxID=1168544 RepID=A0A9P4GM87_9PLEO|nr:uncharacterized protein K460DRAFT_63916 [Cucurbitaria berberidis CBS 394.84]KAF1847779.1 hypothetical protein K460DRAFT_63916 [Cucurbitaria berberidis CBS 394.84]